MFDYISVSDTFICSTHNVNMEPATVIYQLKGFVTFKVIYLITSIAESDDINQESSNVMKSFSQYVPSQSFSFNMVT